MTLPKDIRYSAVKRILSAPSNQREKAIKVEAARLKQTPRSVRNWITRYQNERRDSRSAAPVSAPLAPSNTPPATVGSASRVETSGEVPGGTDLATALESAGIDSGETANEDSSGNAHDYSKEPDEPSPDPITPEQLIAFTETVVVAVPKMVADMKGIKIPDGEMDFTTQDRAVLGMLAPAACKYSPQIMGKAPGAMAIGYLVMVGFCLVKRLGVIKRYAAVSNGMDTSAGNGDGDGAPIDPSSFGPIAVPKDKVVLGLNGFPVP